MKALVLAGGLAQIELLKQLKSRGIETVLLDGSEKAIAIPFADKFIKAQIMDSEIVKQIALEEKADFVLTVCADQVLLICAKVSEELDLPCYIDYDTGVKVSDKTYMKRIFAENNIPTSRYVESDTLDFGKISHLKYPLVVKPIDAYSSKGVRKVQNAEELELCFEEARQISRNGGVIVEEFNVGEEISVDVFVCDGKAELLCVSNSEKIADKDRFIIFRGRYPVNASEELIKKIGVVAQQIADAFNIKNAPMLIQMITDGENVSVLEFCARTGGNMKYLLIKRSCGVDVISAVIDLTLGIKPEIKLQPAENKYIVNDFIYCKEGIFDRLEGFDEMISQGNITDYRVLRPTGMEVNGVRSSSDRIAGVTIQADSLEEFNAKHKAFVEGVKILDVNGNDIMRHDLLAELK